MEPREPSETRRRWTGLKALVTIVAAIVLLHILIVACWMVGLHLFYGRVVMWRVVNEYHNPYAHFYHFVLDRLTALLVTPARAGEAIAPHILFEQPWNQGLALLVGLGGAAVIVWLYQREGAVSLRRKLMLATLRIVLVLLAMFYLSEAVLSVDRTGLPSLVILVDDSASTSVVDPYGDAKVKAAADSLAQAANKPEASRLAVAQGWLMREDARVLRQLQTEHKVKIDLVSASARPLAEIAKPAQIQPALEQLAKVEAVGEQTCLGDGVRQVLTEMRGAPPTAIILLTDGQTTDGESLAKAAEFARSKGVPLFPIGIGDPSPTRDLEVSDMQVDDVVFVDDQVRFEARVGGTGFAGEQVDVLLKRRPAANADPKSAVEVGKSTIRVAPDGQTARVEVRHQPKETGEFVYSLEITPRPRELQVDNNRVEHTVSVRKDKLKVLLADSEPRYEYRYLLSFLKRDKSIDLKAVLQTADPEYAQQETVALPTFPSSKDGPDGLFSFDVLILGDLEASTLGSATIQNIIDFVEKKGGGVLFVAGQNYDPLAYRGTPLEALIPIKLNEARDPLARGGAVPPYRPALTAEGRTHPIFRFADDEAESARIWQTLPELNWFLEAPRKQELAFVLAVHPSQTGTDGPLPILLYQYVGAGKVLFQAMDETWKWRFRTGDRYFGRYWVQAIRFLARSKLLGQRQAEVITDHRRYQRQQPIRAQVRFTNPALAPTGKRLNVQLERKGQPTRQVALQRSTQAQNLFEAVLPPLAEGQYEVKLLPPPALPGGLPSTTFRVDPPAGEFEHVPMNEAELIRAAESSHGKFHKPDVTAYELMQELPAPQMVPLDTDPPISLWNTPLMLVVFLGILVLEWVLRKRYQLV